MQNNIQNKEQYQLVITQIEEYSQKATKMGGLHGIDSQEVKDLKMLSLQAEEYEDNTWMLNNVKNKKR